MLPVWSRKSLRRLVLAIIGGAPPTWHEDGSHSLKSPIEHHGRVIKYNIRANMG